MEKGLFNPDAVNIPLDQFNAPLLRQLMNLIDENSLQFHMPGHKKGTSIPPEVADYLKSNILAMDTTETRGMDNLHSPSGCIKEAQDLAARAINADQAFFLTNGTTAGIHAMLMVTCKPGQKVIIPRDAHLAVIGAVILMGLDPVFVYPEIDPEWGISLGVPVSEYEKALEEHPDAATCLVTRPNYYGLVRDLAPLVEACHKRGKPLLVDEAHGPHICYHEALPLSAIDYGADMVVQSSHKTLGSFTGSSVLYTKGNLIDPKRVQRMLAVLQSTSPSYLLMVSLDIASTTMRLKGKELIDNVIVLSNHAKKRLAGVPGIRVLNVPGMDLFKLTVSMIDLGICGFDLKNRLIDEFNIRVELADMENIIAFITMGDTFENVDKLVDALISIAGHAQNADNCTPKKESHISHKMLVRGRKGTQAEFTKLLFAPAQRAMLPRDAYMSDHDSLPLYDAVGRTCAEVVAPYPPGIPLLYPGEVIDREKIRVIEDALELGAVFRGITSVDGVLKVTVVK